MNLKADNVQVVNISWSQHQLLQSILSRMYIFRAISGNSYFQRETSLRSIVFTAPESAPPCEIYNFSVTATYILSGVTYSGSGCSVPSPVLSRMLPSLPDKKILDSSITYELEKKMTVETVEIKIDLLVRSNNSFHGYDPLDVVIILLYSH